MKGIIFDFNGTLFYDTPMHMDAWRICSERLRGTPFSDEEMEKYMMGRTNYDIIKYAIGKDPDKEEAKRFADEKEAQYRKQCEEDTENTKLVKGSHKLLDYLVEKNIPHTIATASDKANVDFFIRVFELKKWFNLEKIVYDDGNMPNKPAPDIYLKAAKNLGLDPKDCVVIEDAPSGIESAKKAGIGKIIAIAPREKQALYEDIDGVSDVISDFDELDRKIFAE